MGKPRRIAVMFGIVDLSHILFLSVLQIDAGLLCFCDSYALYVVDGSLDEAHAWG